MHKLAEVTMATRTRGMDFVLYFITCSSGSRHFFFLLYNIYSSVAVGLVAHAAQVFVAADARTSGLKRAWMSCHPTSFLLRCSDGKHGTWTRSGHRIRLWLLCRSWMWEGFRVC